MRGTTNSCVALPDFSIFRRIVCGLACDVGWHLHSGCGGVEYAQAKGAVVTAAPNLLWVLFGPVHLWENLYTFFLFFKKNHNRRK